MLSLGLDMSYDNIPREMHQFKSWVLWHNDLDENGSNTKVPYIAGNGMRKAKTNDPSTWSAYDDCINVLAETGNQFTGLGFVLSKNDPYCFVDLDDTKGNAQNYERQLRVYNNFQTYNEYSPSGRGLHLIGYGEVPSGRKRSGIEIYSSGRFMTMTGNLYSNLPIKDVNDLALTLWSQIGKDKGKDFYDPLAPQTMSDLEIMDMAANAHNGSKFLDLYNGNWQQYPEYNVEGQSAADQAFINILAFYTQNREQIARIFHDSELGKRKKAKRKDYVEWTINRSFDLLLPPIDIEGLQVDIQTLLKKKAAPNYEAEGAAMSKSREDTIAVSPDNKGTQTPYTSSRYEPGFPVPLHLTQPPPGLMGRIAQFIYDQSPRQVPEAALAASIGLMSGLCGRAYQVSGTGLNQYTMFLAETGTGKEGITQGIDKIVHYVSQSYPSIQSYFGPAKLMSGQGLIRELEEQPCFVSILGEVSSMLRQVTSDRRSPSDEALREFLLSLYQKNQDTGMMRRMSYADKTKNTKTLVRPSLSLLGESQPATIFEQCGDDVITSGLLPRFTIIEYTGKVPYLNKNFQKVEIPDHLVHDVGLLTKIVTQMDTANHYQVVKFTPDAQDFFDRFSNECTDNMNAKDAGYSRHLWGRAHLKTMKLAALVAVGLDPFNPTIDVIAAQWAKSLVLFDIANMTVRFKSGQLGNNNGETEQHSMMMELITEYINTPYDGRLIGYQVNKLHHTAYVIPLSYLNRRLRQATCFKKSRIGPTNAIKAMAQSLCDEGVLRLVPTPQAVKDFDSTQTCYAIPGYFNLIRKIN